MSSAPIAIPRSMPFGAMAGQLRPLVHSLVEEAANSGLWSPPERGGLRVLEAGSSGGLLSALLLETDLAPAISGIDFVDPFPQTLEAALERTSSWPCRCHFINNSLDRLPPAPTYGLIFTWGLFQGPETDSRLAAEIARRQRPSGLLLPFEETADPAQLAFALHDYRLLAVRPGLAPPGRGASRSFFRNSSLWLLSQPGSGRLA